VSSFSLGGCPRRVQSAPRRRLANFVARSDCSVPLTLVMLSVYLPTKGFDVDGVGGRTYDALVRPLEVIVSRASRLSWLSAPAVPLGLKPLPRPLRLGCWFLIASTRLWVAAT
jgi:hypothetical protein